VSAPGEWPFGGLDDGVDVPYRPGIQYRTQHNLITAAVTLAQRDHHNAHAELATVTAELAKTRNATERYLRAFEPAPSTKTSSPNASPPSRPPPSRPPPRQLTARRDDLAADLDHAPTAPDPATLAQVADHLAGIITSGPTGQRRALVEALVARSRSPDATGSSRLPGTPTRTRRRGRTRRISSAAPHAPVRTPTDVVEGLGIEPAGERKHLVTVDDGRAQVDHPARCEVLEGEFGHSGQCPWAIRRPRGASRACPATARPP